MNLVPQLNPNRHIANFSNLSPKLRSKIDGIDVRINMRIIIQQAVIENYSKVFIEQGTRFLAIGPKIQISTKFSSGPYATVIALGGHATVTRDWLCQELERFRSTDDVFLDCFLHGVIFTGARENAEIHITPDAR